MAQVAKKRSAKTGKKDEPDVVVVEASADSSIFIAATVTLSPLSSDLSLNKVWV